MLGTSPSNGSKQHRHRVGKTFSRRKITAELGREVTIKVPDIRLTHNFQASRR
jgi:hypothetical protein